jgi:RNA polymerase sigma factor (sigma-70 family)
MMADESTRLLREFSRDRSEQAFRELVRLHSPLVFGTALRLLAGDRAAAQDVTQEVFTLLAAKAKTLGGVILPAWLYRQTCRRASNQVRAESRRRKRELVAASLMGGDGAEADAGDDLLGGEIDEVMRNLPSSDRDALVLRFFEGQDFRRLGASLGTTEEAARKRVGRALEKLAAALGKRGLATGTATLVAAMGRLGAAPLPESLVARISTQALDATPSSGSAGAAELLRPALAGILATSLAAGTMLLAGGRALRPPALSNHDTSPAGNRASEGQRAGEDVIAAIKRIHAGPRHTLTTLRLRTTLDGIPLEDLPAFFPLAHDQLTPAEQAACFKLLLERWVRLDPAAALTFMIDHPLWARVDQFEGTNLLNNTFEQWLRADLPAARGWLLAHWDSGALRETAFVTTLGEFLAMQIADTLVLSGRVQESADFIQSIPDEPARRGVWNALTGDTPWMGAWMNIDARRLHELLKRFQSHPDPVFGQTLAASLWRNVMQNSPEKAGQVEALLSPSDRFARHLGSLGVRSRPVLSTPMAGGGVTTRFEQIEAAPVDAEALIRDGVEAGLAREAVLRAVAAAFDAAKDRQQTLAWIDAHRHEVEFDDFILGELRELSGPVTGWTKGDTPYARIIEWACRLADEESGRAISRGAFRRMQSQMPDEVEGFLQREDIPGALRDELQLLMNP